MSSKDIYHGPKVKDTQSFIQKAQFVHGDKYSYEKVEYVNSRSKITINCPYHGAFEQRPTSHLGGCGCPKCRDDSKRSDTETFIQKANVIHENKYSYEKSEYVNNNTKITITCPIHGDFEQIPKHHLNGHGCKRCWAVEVNKNRWQASKDKFTSSASKIHNNKYKYDGAEYVNAHTKLTITCPIHGDFQQTPNNHLNGQGCPSCANSIKKAHIPDRFEDGTFYVVRIYSDTSSFVKLGVTSKTVQERMNRMKGFRIEVLYEYCSSWKHILLLEEQILKTLHHKRYRVHNLKGMDVGGWTECFREFDIDIDEIKDLTNPFC